VLVVRAANAAGVQMRPPSIVYRLFVARASPSGIFALQSASSVTGPWSSPGLPAIVAGSAEHHIPAGIGIAVGHCGRILRLQNSRREAGAWGNKLRDRHEGGAEVFIWATCWNRIRGARSRNNRVRPRSHLQRPEAGRSDRSNGEPVASRS